MRIIGVIVRISLLASLVFCTGCSHCLANDAEDMSSLAASLTKLTKAVEAKVRYDSSAAGMKDQELLKFATQHNPKLLDPFSEYQLKASSQYNHAVVLVCSEDGKKALLQDGACTAQMDNYWWDKSPDRPCEISQELCAPSKP
jgi:hypothetical protein